MLADSSPLFLVASPDPALLAAIEPLLRQIGSRVEIVLSAQAASAAMAAPISPALVLLDENLSGLPSEDPIVELLAGVHAHADAKRFPIVLISDTVTQIWIGRLTEGLIDDLIPRAADTSYWRLRIELALRNFRLAREVESLREAAALHAQMDSLTGIHNRHSLLTMLLRETDRVQRLNAAMTMVLFDIDDFGHWNTRLGAEACDGLLRQVVGRTLRLLRSYDLLGRTGPDEFLVGLPGCNIARATLLAERLRLEVFSVPFQIEDESIRLSACFGIARSLGRSPVVVLRDAEEALAFAKTAGPESLQCFGDCVRQAPAPVTFFSLDGILDLDE